MSPEDALKIKILSMPFDKQVIELKNDAASYSKLGDFSKAQKMIKKALELVPESKNLVHELAKLNLKSKNYEVSLKLLLDLEERISKKNILVYISAFNLKP